MVPTVMSIVCLRGWGDRPVSRAIGLAAPGLVMLLGCLLLAVTAVAAPHFIRNSADQEVLMVRLAGLAAMLVLAMLSELLLSGELLWPRPIAGLLAAAGSGLAPVCAALMTEGRLDFQPWPAVVLGAVVGLPALMLGRRCGGRTFRIALHIFGVLLALGAVIFAPIGWAAVGLLTCLFIATRTPLFPGRTDDAALTRSADVAWAWLWFWRSMVVMIALGGFLK